MTQLVVIDICGAKKSLIGHLQRIMLEIRPGTFVWKLSARKTKQIWEEIIKEECSAICIFAAKNETGFVIATHGENARQVADNFGVQLITFHSKKVVTKIGKSQEG